MALKRQILATNGHKLQDELVAGTSYCLRCRRELSTLCAVR